MRFLISFCFSFVFAGVVFATTPMLQQPLDLPIALSASFGELRPNHFHAGLDFKTEQQCGYAIRSVADGYVSRIKISQFGYGNCLYVTHPQGITTVYAHLDAFNDSITSWVRKYQYAHQTFQMDVQLPDSIFPVSKGDVIAISGNTGSSAGPHLHFEVRNTEKEEAMDPQDYYRIEDTVRPKFKRVGVRPIANEGTVAGQCVFQSYKTWQETAGNYRAKPIEAWGKIGLEVMAFDYMNGQSNFYGLKRLVVLVDNELQFSYVINKFSFEHDRAINAFIDYEQWVKTRDVYMCAYMPQYQPLALFSTKDDAYLNIDQERDYQVEMKAYDYAGNESVLRFVIKGKSASLPLMCNPSGEKFAYDKMNFFTKDSVMLFVPRGALYNDTYFRYSMQYDSTLSTPVYALHENTVPLHKNVALILPIDKDTLTCKNQYYMAYKNTYGKWGYVPASYEKGAMVAKVNKFGEYTVLVDTIAPTIRPMQKTRTKIRFRINDKQTDIATFNGYMDGQWVLFEIDAKNRITYHYDKSRLKAGKYHLRLEVTDRCGNKTVYEDDVRLGY